MNKRTILLVGMVMAAALARLVPHPPNVTPIAAMALFGGACFRDRRLAYLLPLAAMLAERRGPGVDALSHGQPADDSAGRVCLPAGLGGDRAADQGSPFAMAGGRGHSGGVHSVLRSDELCRLGRGSSSTRRPERAWLYATCRRFRTSGTACWATSPSRRSCSAAWRLLENRLAWMREKTTSVPV